MRIHRVLWGVAALLAAGFATASDTAAKARVRPAAVAGSWYPGEAGALSTYLDGLLAAATPAQPKAGRVRALIAPHAGYRYSGATAAEVYQALRGAHYRRVLVLGPAHHGAFRGLSIADVDAYATPLGEIPLDRTALPALRASELVNADPTADRGEHSIEMQLPLLQRVLAPGWRLVPVLVGTLEGQDYAQAADLLRPLVDADTLVVASSDFTHYGPDFGYQPFPLDDRIAARLEQLDKGALAPILAKDAEGFLAYQRKTGITVCGFRPIDLLLRILPAQVTGALQTYTTSGALTGDYTHTVSYMGVLFRDAGQASPQTGTPSGGIKPSQGSGQQGVPPTESAADPAPLSQGQMRMLHTLASEAVASAVRDDPAAWARLRARVQEIPAELKRPSGAFVTLKAGGVLRGCIGYILPRMPLYQAVMKNGGNAALRDPRFQPVRPEELAGLSVEVSVLSLPTPIASYQAFQVGKEGIILNKDGRSAVFLPEVATEQGWNREQTLNFLARKAGLPEAAWREGAELQVFGSQKYEAPLASVGL